MRYPFPPKTFRAWSIVIGSARSITISVRPRGMRFAIGLGPVEQQPHLPGFQVREQGALATVGPGVPAQRDSFGSLGAGFLRGHRWRSRAIRLNWAVRARAICNRVLSDGWTYIGAGHLKISDFARLAKRNGNLNSSHRFIEPGPQERCADR